MKLPIDFSRKLQDIFTDRFSTAGPLREQHGRDESFHPCQPPDAVIYPQSTEEVSEILKLCDWYGVPVIPFGCGTALEGHVTAPMGGVSINTSQMSNIVEVNEKDLDCIVQAGVTRTQLNESLKQSGLFFPVDPGANASLGGMAATGASGTTTIQYGSMRENIFALTVVLADGSIIHTGARSRKSSAGYDLTRLLVGSEGTLAVITELALRLYGIPEGVRVAVSSFSNIDSAVQAVVEIIQQGVSVARIELLDETQIFASNQYAKLHLPEQPHLFLEFHGTTAGTREALEAFSEIAKQNSGENIQEAMQEEERRKLWSARHNAYYAARALKANSELMTTDVCVPLSQLSKCIVKTKEDIEKSQMLAPIVAHAGDGNFHVFIVVDPDSTEDLEKARAFNMRLIDRALQMGGTCTGEHGIGVGKKNSLEKEAGTAVEIMKSIKKTLDPKNIMNPGKIFT